jgi:hypothetical protein
MGKHILGSTGLAVAVGALGITCNSNENRNEELGRAPIFTTTHGAALAPPAFDALFAGSSLEGAFFEPGERRVVNLILINSGTTAWSSSSFMLHWVPNTPFLGFANQSVVPTVGNGQSFTFSFPIVAPSTAGPATFDAQMILYSAAGGQFFGPRVSLLFTVSGIRQAELGASLVSENFPSNPVPGTTFTATVVMMNTGSQDWNDGTQFLFYNRNNPVNTWGLVYVRSPTVLSGNTGTFVLKLKAPTTLPASHLWQMYKVNTGFFGDLVNIQLGNRLHIVDATYGPNCGVPLNGPNPCATDINCIDADSLFFALADIRASCEGSLASQCVYPTPGTGTILSRLGDPALGCSKNYVTHYQCAGGPLKSFTVPNEAAAGTVTFTCP